MPSQVSVTTTDENHPDMDDWHGNAVMIITGVEINPNTGKVTVRSEHDWNVWNHSGDDIRLDYESKLSVRREGGNVVDEDKLFKQNHVINEEDSPHRYPEWAQDQVCEFDLTPGTYIAEGYTAIRPLNYGNLETKPPWANDSPSYTFTVN